MPFFLSTPIACRPGAMADDMTVVRPVSGCQLKNGRGLPVMPKATRSSSSVTMLTSSPGWLKPVTTVVNTHFPFDHAHGNQIYGPAGASVWNSPTIDPRLNVLYVPTGNAYLDAISSWWVNGACSSAIKTPVASDGVASIRSSGAVRLRNSCGPRASDRTSFR